MGTLGTPTSGSVDMERGGDGRGGGGAGRSQGRGRGAGSDGEQGAAEVAGEAVEVF